MENYRKTEKLIKQVWENHILDPRVGYVWKRY